MRMKEFKVETGSVTVEATISLSAFMFAIVTLLTIVNICIVQARVSYAINTTAKEISQYSYLYALTGINQSQSKLSEKGKEDTASLNKIFDDINTVHNEIEKLGDSGLSSESNIEDILNKWEEIEQSLEKGGKDVIKDIEDMAKDPKQIIFGVAKLAGNTAMDTAKSKLIMQPLAKAMSKKHLVSTKDGSVEDYLKSLGVVPDVTGSYYKGLDFEGSTLFPNGSSEIKICVSYDVKVIALLPIDFSFHFKQTAITHGWLAGEVSFKNDKEKIEKLANDTLWTQATVQERTQYIRTLSFNQLKSEGYDVLAYPYNTDGILFSSEKNEFVMPRSWNPFSGTESISPDDLNETVMKNYIEMLCGTINSNEFGPSVTVKKEKSDGSTEKIDVNCENATNKIILTIPEDKGLKEKIQSIIDKSNTGGVTIELIQNYGNGAKEYKATEEKGEDK